MKNPRLERRAYLLGMAHAVDFGVQFLLPVVLARVLDVESFGKYRLLWLAVLTMVPLATLAMPASLYYFLPRSDAAHKRLYINQTLLFLCMTSLISAWVVSPLDPWRPVSVRGLSEPDLILPLFAFLWTVASLLDLLPVIDERIKWQAKLIVGLSVLRAAALSVAAIATGELQPVFLTLLGFVLVKLWLLLSYIVRHHGLSRPVLRWPLFMGQVRHAVPIGLSGALYGLRGQADQWIAATLFSIGMFASFSVAAVISPLIYICRQSVNQVFLPSMSRLEAGGDMKGMLSLNSRANVMVGTLAYPLLAFAFAFANDIISLIYTPLYLEGAPVMRVYVVGMVALVVELSSVMLLLKQGPFAMRVNAMLLAFSVAVSWQAAHHFGLPGAAVGSVLAVYGDRFLTLRRISMHTGIAVSRMQDWRSLGMLFLTAVVSMLVVWALVHGQLADRRPIVRLAVATPLMAVVYMGLYAMLNREALLIALRRRREGSA